MQSVCKELITRMLISQSFQCKRLLTNFTESVFLLSNFQVTFLDRKSSNFIGNRFVFLK